MKRRKHSPIKPIPPMVLQAHRLQETIKSDTSGSESEAETMAAKYLAHDMAKNYMPRILPPLTQTVLDVLNERKTTEENTHVTH